MSPAMDRDDAVLVVRDRDELRALSKALVVGKFHGNGADAVWGSPRLAQVQARLLAALSASDDDWEAWAVADDKDWVVAWVEARLGEAQDGDWWPTAAPEQRRQYILALCAPFQPSGSLLARLTAHSG